jgi:hypothetical protein
MLDEDGVHAREPGRTIRHFKVTAGGCTRWFRTEVAEPETGRILTEFDTGSSAVTTFNGTALKFPDLWGLVSGFIRAGHGLTAGPSR